LKAEPGTKLGIVEAVEKYARDEPSFFGDLRLLFHDGCEGDRVALAPTVALIELLHPRGMSLGERADP
jgi:hypothetical protein